jgi:fused signal recognition particle receptor
MVFDFIRKRTEEGIAQVQNIATKTLEGRLSEALADTADYVRQRQLIDAENLKKLSIGLSKTRDKLLSGINGAFDDNSSSSNDLSKKLDSLEEVLLQADIGSTTTNQIIDDLRSYAQTNQISSEDVLPILRERLIEALTPPTGMPNSLNIQNITTEKSPTVIFVIGANGMGKTTTIGKIAARLNKEGNFSVLLGACDTFRAAAVEQLNEWARRANVSIEVPIDNEKGGNPVPVVTRTMKRGITEGVDVIIIDTSGRLSNNFELIEQLKDMKSAIQKEIPNAPHETLLVVDGSVGRNAIDQAIAWKKYVGITGIAVTKLDGTARAGFVVSIVRDLGVPIKFIGVGEKIEDLRDFQPNIFVDALLGNDEQTSLKLQTRVKKMLLKGTNSGSSNSGSSNTDSTKRLMDSFSSSGSDEEESSEDKEVIKSKRPKRPKPQQSKAKLKKKDK